MATNADGMGLTLRAPAPVWGWSGAAPGVSGDRGNCTSAEMDCRLPLGITDEDGGIEGVPGRWGNGLAREGRRSGENGKSPEGLAEGRLGMRSAGLPVEGVRGVCGVGGVSGVGGVEAMGDNGKSPEGR